VVEHVANVATSWSVLAVLNERAIIPTIVFVGPALLAKRHETIFAFDARGVKWHRYRGFFIAAASI
jgi:hypothetical protein